MRKIKRGYADIELWRFIGKLSEDLGRTKQETSGIVADYLKNDEKLKQSLLLPSKKKERHEFDFRF